MDKTVKALLAVIACLLAALLFRERTTPALAAQVPDSSSAQFLKKGDRIAVSYAGILYVYAYDEKAPKNKRLRQMASDALNMQ